VTAVFLEMSCFANARCNDVFRILITSVVRSATIYKVLVATHDDKEKQAKPRDAFFKRKIYISNLLQLDTHFVPKFVPYRADTVERRVTGKLRTKSILVVVRWKKCSWEGI
jgi:hypothetical protein